MQQILQFTTSYTLADMVVFNRIANKIYPSKKITRTRVLYGIMGTVGIVLSAYTFAQGTDMWLAVLAFLIGLWYLWASVWYYQILGRRSYKNRPEGVERMRFTFDKTGMVVENAFGHSRFGFADVEDAGESKTLFVLFTSQEKRQGYLIPKQNLPSVDAFRTMLETQYGCQVQQFKY